MKTLVKVEVVLAIISLGGFIMVQLLGLGMMASSGEVSPAVVVTSGGCVLLIAVILSTIFLLKGSDREKGSWRAAALSVFAVAFLTSYAGVTRLYVVGIAIGGGMFGGGLTYLFVSIVRTIGLFRRERKGQKQLLAGLIALLNDIFARVFLLQSHGASFLAILVLGILSIAYHRKHNAPLWQVCLAVCAHIAILVVVSQMVLYISTILTR